MKVKKLALIGALTVWLPGHVSADEEVDELRAIDAAGIVHVHCVRGELKVIGWDRPEARVSGRLDDLARDLQFETRDDHTLIRVRMPNSGVNRGDGSNLVIHLPRGVQLQVESVSADVTLESMNGPVAVRTVSGDVTATGLRDWIRVNTTSGDVELSEGSGGVSVSTTSGDTFVELAASNVRVESVSGDVELRLASFDSVATDTVSAELEIEGTLNPGGSIYSTSINSEVDIRLTTPINAVVDVQTGPGGDIDNDLSDQEPERLASRGLGLNAMLGDGSGSIRIVSVSGEVSLGTR